MAASYPLAIKSFTTKVNLVTDVMAVDINDLQDEVVALESIIGVDPLSMVNKDPNQIAAWTSLSQRLDALDKGLTRPIFSSWSDITNDPAGSARTTTWGPYQTYGLADSPDNYPGGKYGQHPTYAPALEMTGAAYGFEWTSQSQWVAYKQADVIRLGGEADGTQYRVQVITVSTVPSSAVDANGFFTLPTPPAGYDPLGWYNGSNGFTIKKSGWYHLTGSMKWASMGNTGGLQGTHRMILWAGNKAVAEEDIEGAVGSDGLYVTTSFTGIITAGTNVGIGAAVFKTAEFRAGQARLSGVFLRGV